MGIRVGFPLTDGEIRELALEALLTDPMPKQIARKADVRLGTGTSLVDIWSSLAVCEGYVVAHPISAGTYLFPDGTNSLSAYRDMTGANEARLLVWVSEASVGTTLAIELTDASFTSGRPEVDVGTTGLKLTDWKPLEADGAALARWVITAASAGEFTVGLCQLQVR